MSQFKAPTSKPIKIICLDPILHTEANHFNCHIAGCPCQEQATMPNYWPGSMMSIERDTSKRQAIARQSDPTETEILQRWTAPLPDAIEPAMTWRVEARHHRRISVWHRIKQLLSWPWYH